MTTLVEKIALLRNNESVALATDVSETVMQAMLDDGNIEHLNDALEALSFGVGVEMVAMVFGVKASKANEGILPYKITSKVIEGHRVYKVSGKANKARLDWLRERDKDSGQMRGMAILNKRVAAWTSRRQGRKAAGAKAAEWVFDAKLTAFLKGCAKHGVGANEVVAEIERRIKSGNVVAKKAA